MNKVNFYGALVKRSRHRPFTAVARVRFSYASPNYVSMVESADTVDSKSIAEKRVGSSPTTDTKYAALVFNG